MGELNESLSNLYEVSFLIPTPTSIPFTERWKINRSTLIHSNVKRVHYWSIPKRKKPTLTKRFLLKNILANISASQSDIIHIHWAYPEILLLPEIKKLGKPVFITFHGYLFYDIFNNNSLRPYLYEAINSADKIFTVGKQLETDIKTYFPQQSSKVFHIANGINENKFVLGDKKSARNKLGFSQDKIHILCVANLAHEKGLDVLVDAIAASSILKSSHLHIIGRTIDQSLLKGIKTVIKEQNIKNITIHGPVPHEELARYYHASDAFVLPSRVEGFGVALVEAGMCGLPMVSTYSGGPAEIISSEIGLLAQAGDINDLRNKLETLLDNIENYNPERIRSLMIENFSQSTVVKSIQAHYEDLL